ncbi:MAG: 3,4-dihydroxy-2-butanone-4-phosphate synthase [Armatimonadetes bacterium]|nr:3,4-dihydroxy-2-butanone-4-phosphate synthase [Armatimonadota bacterium]
MTVDTNIERALAALQAGELVALLDHPEREGEADLLLAAELATGEKLNEMISLGRGLVTIAMTEERLLALGIRLLDPMHCGPNWPRFAAPVDYTLGTTTGVSAFDRAVTARALADPDARPEHFARPGHLFPLAAAPGGLRERAGHTEGAVSLALLAGLRPAVVMCEMLAPDGHMARGPLLAELLQAHALPAVTVAEVAERLGASV